MAAQLHGGSACRVVESAKAKVPDMSKLGMKRMLSCWCRWLAQASYEAVGTAKRYEEYEMSFAAKVQCPPV